MDTVQYYVLQKEQSIGKATTDYFRIKPDRMGKAPKCVSCGNNIGLLQWLPPLKVGLKTYGEQFGDFVFGGGEDFLVSEQFRLAYTSAMLIGLESFDPVEVISIKGKGTKKAKLPQYYRVFPAFSNAAIDDARSEVVREKTLTCSRCRSNGIVSLKRIILEDRTWLGEDIFIARGLPGIVLVSSRFVNTITSAGLEGTDLIAAEHYAYNMS